METEANLDFDKIITGFEKKGFPDLEDACVGQFALGALIASVSYEAEKIMVFSSIQTIEELAKARDRQRAEKNRVKNDNALNNDTKTFSLAIIDATINQLTGLIEIQFKSLDFALRNLPNEQQRTKLTAFVEGIKSRLGINGTWF